MFWGRVTWQSGADDLTRDDLWLKFLESAKKYMEKYARKGGAQRRRRSAICEKPNSVVKWIPRQDEG